MDFCKSDMNVGDVPRPEHFVVNRVESAHEDL